MHKSGFAKPTTMVQMIFYLMGCFSPLSFWCCDDDDDDDETPRFLVFFTKSEFTKVLMNGLWCIGL